MEQSKLSSDDYLKIKLRPIFNSMTESLIRESPKEAVSTKLKIIFF